MICSPYKLVHAHRAVSQPRTFRGYAIRCSEKNLAVSVSDGLASIAAEYWILLQAPWNRTASVSIHGIAAVNTTPHHRCDSVLSHFPLLWYNDGHTGGVAWSPHAMNDVFVIKLIDILTTAFCLLIGFFLQLVYLARSRSRVDFCALNTASSDGTSGTGESAIPDSRLAKAATFLHIQNYIRTSPETCLKYSYQHLLFLDPVVAHFFLLMSHSLMLASSGYKKEDKIL